MKLMQYTYPNRSYLGSFSRLPWVGLENEINRLFEGTLRSIDPAPVGRFPLDIYEDKDNTYVRAELPGFDRDALKVELTDGYLTINASRHDKTDGAENTTTFHRSVTVDEEKIDSGNIGAAYENGVLTITLPHRAEAKPRKVTVAVR